MTLPEQYHPQLSAVAHSTLRYLPPIIALSIGAFWFMLTDDRPVVMIPPGSVPVLIDNGPVIRGGALRVRYRLRYVARCSGYAQGYFIDQAKAMVPTEPYSFYDGVLENGDPVPLDKDIDVVVSIPVPEQLTPGPDVQYQNIAIFYRNPVQRWLNRPVVFYYPVVHFALSRSVAPSVAREHPIFRPLRPAHPLPVPGGIP